MFLSSDFVFVFGHCKGMNNSVCFKITFDVCHHVFRRFRTHGVSNTILLADDTVKQIFPRWERSIPSVGI